MKFSYNWIKELTGIKESPQKLAEFLTLKVFEVESIAKKGGDWALDIKLLPNRAADASGHIGMAKEIATLKKLKISAEGGPASGGKNPKTKIVETNRKTRDVLRVRIEKLEDCPRYTARVMTGVKVGPSPKWMRERLDACGLQSINNLVDAANYVMLESGQPLHVFDLNELETSDSQKRETQNPKPETRNKFQNTKFKTIIVRRAKNHEKLLALDDKIYELNPEILVIADEFNPIAIAGIKGGKESGVSEKTKNIVLESANFEPVRIRVAAKLLGLKTDASYRFERGMDPNQTADAIDRLAEIIKKVAGGEVLAGRADVYPKPPKPARILLRTEYASRLIGEAIAPQFYEASFKRLGWGYLKKSKDYVVIPPTERRDIQIEEDIIEEMTRLWGYDKIRARAPTVHLAPQVVNEELQWENRVKDILAASGFTEAHLYNFIGKKTLDVFEASDAELLELANPTNPSTQYLTGHPAWQYLEAASSNIRNHDSVAFFGVAKGFKKITKPSQKTPAEEKKYLIIVKISKAANNSETFYEVKGVLERLFESLGVSDCWYDDALTGEEKKKAAALHPYRAAKVMAGDEFLGMAAELHPRVYERLKIKGRLAFAELDFDKLWKLARSEQEFHPIGKYPAIIRDIAVVAPLETKADDVQEVIENTGGKLLADSDLFDYFQDEAMEERGEKSLAFHLVFQSPERTLTDQEVNRIYKKIVAAVKEKGWEVRE